MIRHLLQRVGDACLTLIVISFVIHVALDDAPGDAADALAGDTADQAQMTALRRELNLDAPLLTRYADYVLGILTRGDWGRSMAKNRPVGELLKERLPKSALLAASSLGVAVLAGGTLGVLAARRHDDWVDTLIIGATSVSMACPTYWLALLLFWLFALHLNWLPVLAGDGIEHLLLPVVTLSVPLTASMARFVRAQILRELHKGYVDTARAKGADERRVFVHHVLRNALGPILTLAGLHLGHLLGGAFIIETLYAWPGLGGLMVQAIFDRDHPVVMGTSLLIGAGYIVINLGVDLIHSELDPRTRIPREVR
jgi:ABC-type dipeptide/oligopeptide/nickel transport system permease component